MSDLTLDDDLIGRLERGDCCHENNSDAAAHILALWERIGELELESYHRRVALVGRDNAIDIYRKRIEKLTAENKQLNTDLRIALSVQGANGFNLSLKESK